MRTTDEFAALVRQAAWEAFDALCREDGKDRSAEEIARQRPLVAVAANLLIKDAPPEARDADDEEIRGAVGHILRTTLAPERPS